MRSVIISITTKDYTLQSGESDGNFVYSVHKVGDPDDGSTDVAQKTTVTQCQFSLDAGDYVATVSKLGAQGSASFTVPVDPTAVVQVPDVVSVSLVALPSDPAAPAPSPAVPPATGDITPAPTAG